MKLLPAQIRAFQQTVLDYYHHHGRDLPWRLTVNDQSAKPIPGRAGETCNPYYILVSEVMLQQTQAERVTPKFQQFIKRFPTVNTLAAAPAGDILRAWQGLGYNRRALALHKTAQAIVSLHRGRVPDNSQLLQQLPGIGPYTAAAILVFAFNQPVVVVETNIRSVFIHHFFPRRQNVHDDEIIPLIEQTLDTDDPAAWYHALMDYGAHLKRRYSNPSRQSRHYTKQSRFEGSNRQLRGAIIKALARRGPVTLSKLSQSINSPPSRVRQVARQLEIEGFIVKKRQTISLITH